MDKLVKRMDWALTMLIGIFETGARGLAPPNEVFCCNIWRRRTFVRSVGFGRILGTIWAINPEVTDENKPA